MCRLVGDVWCPYWGSGAFPALWRGWRIVGRGSSVKLPLDHVDRDVEKVACEDHGDPEGVAIPKEGQ